MSEAAPDDLVAKGRVCATADVAAESSDQANGNTAAALHGLRIIAAEQLGVLMDLSFDANGDIDRASFMTEVRGGKQEIKELLPALNAK